MAGRISEVPLSQPGFTRLLGLEWQLLSQDRWLRSLLTWIPVLVFILVWWLFSSGLTRELPIAVVDHDHSQFSRDLTRQFDASPTLQVQAFTSENAGQDALRRGEVFALVLIPQNLQRDTLRGQQPSVSAYYNAQFMVVGKQINSALRQSHGTFVAQLEVGKALSQGNTQVLQALGQAVPIRNQISALYNGNSNYAQFIVSAALPAFWQILLVVVTILSVGAELRQGSLRQWLQQSPYQKISAKLLLFGGLLWLQGILLCCLMFHLFGWPMRGSWSLLLLGLLLCVLASQAIALLMMLLFEDMARSLSFAGALTAPSFAFMGITFPVSDMSWFAQFWRNLIPVTHYVEIQVAQANYGAPAAQSMADLGHLLLFGICFISCAWLVQIRRSNWQGAS